MGRAKTILLAAFALTVSVAGSQSGALASSRALPPAPPASPSLGGDQLWFAHYDGAKNSDLAAGLVFSPDGLTVFVTGSSFAQTGESDYATIAYDSSSGSKLWVARYSAPGTSYDFARAIAVSPDGSTVFVTGFTDHLSGASDYGTVAYDAATGAELWVTRFRARRMFTNRAFALGVSPDGSMVYVTGNSNGSRTYQDYFTIAYDTSTGHRVWATRYTSPGQMHDFATQLGVSADGSAVFVSGGSYTPAISDYVTVAYDASTGNQLWVATFDTGDPGVRPHVNALRVSPDSSTVFVAGGMFGPMPSDYVTLAYDVSTGNQLWVARYHGAGAVGDAATGLGVSPDGSTVFVTGGSLESSGTADDVTLAYDGSTGNQLWVARYNGPGNGDDNANALGVSPDGSTVLVTGETQNPNHTYYYATLAYSASTGNQLWAALFTHGGNGSATALAVSPDGSKVVVTGSAGMLTDYYTVAYGIS